MLQGQGGQDPSLSGYIRQALSPSPTAVLYPLINIVQTPLISFSEGATACSTPLPPPTSH